MDEIFTEEQARTVLLGYLGVERDRNTPMPEYVGIGPNVEWRFLYKGRLYDITSNGRIIENVR